MNKCFRIAVLMSASIMALSACSKESVTPSTSYGGRKTITFNAGPVDTKTVFGDKAGNKYPTLWTANQQVAISYNLGAFQNVDITDISEDQTTASFTATIEPDLTEGATHTFYAVSPAYNVSLSNGKIKYTMPGAQGPTLNSCEDTAQLLFAKSSSDEISSSVDLNFHHLLAYGKVRFVLPTSSNGVYYFTLQVMNSGGQVEQVSGSILLDPETSEITFDPSSDQLGNTISVLNMHGVESYFYFAILPIGDLNGKTMVLTVYPNSGSKLSKTISFSEPGKLAFNAGQVSEFTVNFTK